MKKTGPVIVFFSKILAFLFRILLRCRYRVCLKGTEILSNGSPVLYLPNHQAMIDPVILTSRIYRFSTVTPVISEKYYDLPLARWYFKQMGAVRVSDLETGNRDTGVLRSITRQVYKGFRRKNSILIYPSGQLTGQGIEKIFNKKAACQIVKRLPEDVQIVGVRITGLWGSMWSKAKSGKSPDVFVQLLKGAFYLLANLLFFAPKRKVTIEFEDITETAREKAALGLKPFNSFLEDFYNLHGEEPVLLLKHIFWLP